MMMKLLGFTLLALPGVAGFAAYGMAQDKGMSPLASAALAGAAFAAAKSVATSRPQASQASPWSKSALCY